MFRTRLPKLVSLLALLTVFCFTTGAAHAQSARKLLKKGNKLFAAGDYKGAFQAFEAGNKKRPSPSFLRSMAFCKMKLYEHKAAQRLFERYLKKYKRARDRKKLQDTLKKLEDVVATVVKISSTPSGADIYIDAEAAGKIGQTPKTVTIEPGTHTLILRKAGFAPTTKTFTIKSRESKQLAVPMEVPFKLESEPSGAEVFIDDAKGKPLGKTPLTDATIAPGQRTIYLKAKGFKTFVKKLDVNGALALTGPSKIKLNLGLRIDSVPPGAVVSIDGTKIEGVTPLEAAVTPGTHKVKISLEGFKDYDKTVSVAPGTDASFKATMRGGLLSMRSGPAGAKVKVGGIELGKTPLVKVPVPLGTKTVQLEHPSRRPWKKSLAFDDTTLVDAKVELGAPSWPFWLMAGTAAAAGIAGGVLGAIAIGRKDSFLEIQTDTYDPDGEGPIQPTSGVKGQCYNIDDNSYDYASHDASTGLLIGAGVVAAASLAYYLFWMRPSEKIARRQRATAKKRTPSRAPRKVATTPQPQPAL